MKLLKWGFVFFVSCFFTSAFADVSEAFFTPQSQKTYPPVSVGEVVVYVANPGFRYSVIGVLEARGMAVVEDVVGQLFGGRSRATEQDDINLALEALKREAAANGASGVLITNSYQVNLADNASERRIKAFAIVRQREESFDFSALGRVMMVYASGMAELCRSPEYRSVLIKSPCNVDDLKISDMVVGDFIAAADKPLFLDFQSKREVLQKNTIASIRALSGPVSARVADVLLKSEYENSVAVMDLYSGAISWGGFNKKRRDINLDLKEKLNAIRIESQK